MNIDKFGHTVHKRLRLGNFISSEKLLKTTLDGHLDVQSKRLTGLHVPINSNDAVTKKYVDDHINKVENVMKELKKEINSLKQIILEKKKDDKDNHSK